MGTMDVRFVEELTNFAQNVPKSEMVALHPLAQDVVVVSPQFLLLIPTLKYVRQRFYFR